MSLDIKINGISTGKQPQKKSLKITRDKAKKRSLSLKMWYSASETFPKEGQSIEVFDDVNRRFGGTIDTVSKSAWTPQTGTDATILLTITSKGYKSIPRRRYTVPNFTGGYASDIITFMITNYLAAEGVTQGSIATGGSIGSYGGEAENIETTCDNMAELSGYYWDIDDDKGLDFVPTTSLNYDDANPIIEGERTHFNFNYNDGVTGYANKVFIYGNGVSTILEDTAEIAARALIEGGTGVYGFKFTDNNILTQADCDAVATELLDRMKTVGSCTFGSYKRFSVGTTIPITYPKYGIAADTYFHIMSRTSTRTDNDWVYSYQLEKRSTTSFSGKKKDDAADYIRQLKKQSNTSTEASSIISITSATNASEHSGSSINLEGLDVTMTDDTVVAYGFTINIEPSTALTATLGIRIDSIEQKNTLKYFGTTNKDNMNFIGTLPKQLAGTYTIDATITTDTGTIVIDPDDYEMTLWVRGGQAEEGAPYPVANVSETLTYPTILSNYLTNITDDVTATTQTPVSVNPSETITYSTVLSSYLSNITDDIDVVLT